jgi:pimeloyl-ACP methyl ester carboxylesterase
MSRGSQREYERFYFSGSNCTLSAIDYGNAGKPDMVIVHGMRDHALSMAGIAGAFYEDYRVLVPDLRGHGDSQNPGSYTMVQFVADLRALVLHRKLTNPVLIGHSLGGHITSKYAAIYPRDVAALVLIDGMGPPRGPESTPDMLMEGWRNNVENALQLTSERRAMKDSDEAFERLTTNNPKLDHLAARRIIDHGVEAHPDGGVRWKWDPAVSMVWSTFDQRESERQWAFVECPVLIVTGEQSMRYWSRRNLSGEAEEGLHARETERRRKLFRDARHVDIADAGHMIHYDQPEALNDSIVRFLGSRG